MSTRVGSINSPAEDNLQTKEDFIRRCFTCKECTQFVGDGTAGSPELRCGCGELIENHYNPNEKSSQTAWSRACIKTVGPSNAYGVVKFFSGAQNLRRSAEFVRLSDEDDPLNVIELMDKHWKLLGENPPLLCISVIGGPESLTLEGLQKAAFCEGLIGAAQASNAWILTDGLDWGVVSVVSDATEKADRYYFSKGKMSDRFRCIGVTPWGHVLNRERLVRSTTAKPRQSKYPISREISYRPPVSLDKNHSHFIFVDDGTRNGVLQSSAAQFRKELECLIATPRFEGGCGVPLLRIIVDGGYEGLVHTVDSVTSGIPVVICTNTERIRNIIDKATHFWTSNETSRGFSDKQAATLKEMLTGLLRSDTVGKDADWTAETGISLLESIMEHENLVSCFVLNEMSSGDTFDKSILYALIKSSTTDPNDQLLIALKFGRIDVVQEEILSKGVNYLKSRMRPSRLKAIMSTALLEDRTEFVQFLIDLELVKMQTYLDMHTLNWLYNNVDDASILKTTLNYYGVVMKQSSPSLIGAALMATTANVLSMDTETAGETNRVLEMLLQRGRVPAKRDWTNLPTISELLLKMLGSFSSTHYVEVTPFTRQHLFPEPFQELFIWAVLNNRNALAMLFWRYADDAVPLGLIGCNLYHKIARALPTYDTEGRIMLANQKSYLEQTSKEMIELCYSKSNEKAIYLLERPLSTWGGHRCMQLAVHAKCRQFIASVACQHAINFEWRMGIHANPFALILGYICPLLLCTTKLIRFEEPSKLLEVATGNDIFQQLGKRLKPTLDTNKDDVEPSIPNSKKLEMFYRAPRTKFCAHTAFYAVFLVFFSYTLLFGLKADRVTVLEAILMVYLCSFGVETVRSFLKSAWETGSVGFHLAKWLRGNKWHPYDVALIFGCATAIALRLGLEETFIYAKSVYSIVLVFFFLRLFQMYAINRKLGPKSVMIFHMLVELAVFLLILLIFLVPYGISTQAMLFPYVTEFNAEMVKAVFYYPYYRLYGELFLEESEGRMEGCDGSKADGIKCPVFSVIPPIFLAVYMLIAVVLLVNLLIAIFSNVFAEIEAQSLQFWMSTKYYLLLEYKAKTIVPAPFGVIQVVLEVVAYLMTLCVKAMRRLKPPVGVSDVEESVNAAYEMKDAEEGHGDDDDDDEDDDDLELSVTEMQHWAARQVLQRETVDETNQLASIRQMVENVHKTLVADGSGAELKAVNRCDWVAREMTELSRTDSTQHASSAESSVETPD